MMSTLGVAMLAFGGSYGAGALVALSGILNLYVGRRTARDADALQRIRAAWDRHASGQTDAARALLAEARAMSPAPAVERIALLAEASFELAEGDVRRTIELASTALDKVPAPRFETWSRATGRATWSTDVALLGVRSLARALDGDDEGAAADASSLEARMQGKRPTHVAALQAPAGGTRVVEEALARVRLAQAIGLARKMDRPALARHLETYREQLSRDLAPRERALVRGFDRLLTVPAPSPYRASIDGAAEGWAEDVLTQIVSGERASAREAETSDERGAMGVSGGRDAAARHRIAVAAAFSVFMVALGGSLVAWQSSVHSWSPALLLAVLLAPLGMFLAWVLRTSSKASRAGATLMELRLRVAASPGLDHARILEGHRDADEPITRAHANLALAHEANAEGAFAVALEHAERGLVPLHGRILRGLVAPSLMPSLVFERALAKAALGRTADAIADVSTIPDGVAFRTRARETVYLVACARGGPAATAARAARFLLASPCPIDAHIERLARVVVAVDQHGEVGLSEMDRLHRELAPGSAERAWLDAVAPALGRAFDAIEHEGARADRDVASALAAEDEALAEAEAGAEAEADAQPRAARRLA